MRVAVLGAGFQGTCIALELAMKGVEVDLYEKESRSITQASIKNEGKIHLGYVYGNDRSGRTARKMVAGAAAFAPLMRRWIGNAIDRVPISKPFHYAVHRDSILSADEVDCHLRACRQMAVEQGLGDPRAYFGVDATAPHDRLSAEALASFYDHTQVTAAFETPEIGIDAEALADAVRTQVASEPSIRGVYGARVRGVSLADDRVEVAFVVAGAQHREGYDHVVNALWTGRLAIDATVGLIPSAPWMFRMKYFLRTAAATEAIEIPSTTIVLGPFGDVVTYRDGGLYLSWYPAAMRHTSTALEPPDWPAEPDRSTSNDISNAVKAALSQIVPALGTLPASVLDSARVGGGVIFAFGNSDIDDEASGLHERHAIGARSFGRYHSVDTGKFTTAPLFASQLVDRIVAG